MGLYQDERPSDFDEVIGNRATINTLKSMLDEDADRRPHVFLFTGDSGTGKTTIARIMADKLGCSEFDLHEVDSATFRGIDSIREIRKQAPLKPLIGKTKVWILDEIHAITRIAQDSLLKLLEDYPSHCYFFLCTTDAGKLLKTIKTRCIPFHLESFTDKQMETLITTTAEKYDAVIPEDAVKQITKDSLGSPRQALVLLEKILPLDEEEMLESVKQYAEIESETIQLCRALFKQDWKTVSKVLSNLKVEPESVRRAVLGYYTNTLLRGSNDKAFGIALCFEKNYYDTGKAGLILSCYDACTS